MFPGHLVQENESIRIRKKHVYRSRSTDPNAIVFDLKLNDIRKAAMTLQRLQDLRDLIASSLKRQREGGDGLDEPTRQFMKTEVDILEDGLDKSDEE